MLKLRALMVSLLLMAVAVTAGAQPPTPKAPTGPSPVIEIPKMSHDLGDIYRQDKYVHTFIVRNRGNAELLIEDVKPG